VAGCCNLDRSRVFTLFFVVLIESFGNLTFDNPIKELLPKPTMKAFSPFDDDN
jgi:hypothetical protein